MKKLIDFFSSNINNLDDIKLLNNVENQYESDIAFYINKKLFDYNKCEGSLLFTPIKYFANAYTIYGNVKINNDNGLMDIFVDYEYGGSERYSLYNLDSTSDSRVLVMKLWQSIEKKKYSN